MPLTKDEIGALLDGPRRAAQTRAAVGQEDNPDDAANSMSLSKETGVPSAVINADPENFSRIYRQKLTSDIVGGEPQLQQYINADPAHAKVSNDDWGNLATLSQAIKRYQAKGELGADDIFPANLGIEAVQHIGGPGTFEKTEEARKAIAPGGSMLVEGLKGFLEGFGPQPPGSWYQDVTGQWSLGWTALGFLHESLFRGASGVLVGTQRASRAAFRNIGLSETEADRGAAAITGMLETEMLGARGQLSSGIPKSSKTAIKQFISEAFPPDFEIQQFIKEKGAIEQALEAGQPVDIEQYPFFKAFAQTTKPFVKAGEMPPQGINRVIDEIYKQQAKGAADAFKDVEKAHAASNTVQRSPEAGDAFMRQHDDSMVGLTPDALQKVYGEEAPAPGDGKLGDLKDVIGSWQAAVASGSPINVTMREWLQYVKPELRKELEDFLIHGDNGISKEQAKEPVTYPKVEEPKPGEPVPPPATEQEQALNATKEAAGTTPLPIKEPLPDIEDLTRTALSKKYYELWMDSTAAEERAEREWMQRRNEAVIAARQTKEWNARKAELSPTVKADVEQRPDVALAEFMHSGMYNGENLKIAKLDPTKLTPEQRNGLGEFIRRYGGRDPEEVANMFNFPTVDEMVNSLKSTAETRRRHGIGHDMWKAREIKAELDRRLEEEFGGELAQNILDEARAQVTGPTTLRRVFAEYENLVHEAGGEPADYPTFRRFVRELFNDQTLRQHTANVTATGLVRKTAISPVRKYQDASGRAYRKAVEALQTGKDTEAFSHRLDSVTALHMAAEGRKLETAMKSFGRMMDRFQEVNKPGIPAHYSLMIHDLMNRFGQPFNMDPANLAAEIARSPYRSLEDFVNHQIGSSRTIDVAPWLFNARVSDIHDLSVNQFYDLLDAFKSLEHNARDESKITVKGEKEDLQVVLHQMSEAVRRHGIARIGESLRTTMAEGGRAGMAMLLQPESFFKMLDAGDPQGIWTQTLGFPAARASGEYNRMVKEIGDDIHAASKNKINAKAKINNKLIIDINGQPKQMTIGDLIRGAAYSGLESGWQTYVEGEFAFAKSHGYTGDVERYGDELWRMIDKNLEKNHWQYIREAIWDPYEKITKWTADMERAEGGIPFERLEPVILPTRHGRIKGGYAPLEPDTVRRPPDRTERDGRTEGATYRRASTPTRHTHKRTGDAYPLNHNLESISTEMKLQIRDVAFRPFQKDASKIVYNNNMRNLLTKHFGDVYPEMLENWNYDLGNRDNINSKAENVLFSMLNFATRNVVGGAIVGNPITIGKHGLTAFLHSAFEDNPLKFGKEMMPRWSRELLNMTYGDKFLNDLHNTFAMENSRELPFRHQGWVETLRGKVELSMGAKNWEQRFADLAVSPIAYFDMKSARLIWRVAFKREAQRMIAEGRDIHNPRAMNELIDLADYAVRQTHGTMAESSKPEVMRGGGFSKTFTTFYVFASNMFQRNFEIAWRQAEAKRSFKETRADGENFQRAFKAFYPHFKKSMALVFSYIFMTFFADEVFDSEFGSDSKMALLAKFVALPFTFVPYAREFVTAIEMHQRDPNVGMITQIGKDLIEPATVLQKKDPFGEKNYGHMMQAVGAFMQIFTRMPVERIGKAARFHHEWMRGRERPIGIIQPPWSSQPRRSILGGYWHGTARDFSGR